MEADTANLFCPSRHLVVDASLHGWETPLILQDVVREAEEAAHFSVTIRQEDGINTLQSPILDRTLQFYR